MSFMNCMRDLQLVLNSLRGAGATTGLLEACRHSGGLLVVENSQMLDVFPKYRESMIPLCDVGFTVRGRKIAPLLLDNQLVNTLLSSFLEAVDHLQRADRSLDRYRVQQQQLRERLEMYGKECGRLRLETYFLSKRWFISRISKKVAKRYVGFRLRKNRPVWRP